ncbi:MAG: phosphocarrier protein HPr [Candidatus Petromonas sp.]|uniref:PTS sugar transporter subunit IIA n=1 Tax=Petrotoga halophila DSM 16923 TaxID=1122953 RepID=A0A2S5E958_9BACT|nr:HPr family phosphocarrier protein [Petrotoga halophila]MDK2920374.1 phosphocarrier protein HPr [Candidatus Petromonas sp.]POZ89581.1 PTS sugar transporter subunit IIA [Petrotoga halophila DSM 16923]
MVEKKVEIKNKIGLHARPAAQLVQKASKFKSNIEIIFNEKKVSAKSIIGVMSLGVTQGNEIILRADGEDAEEAIKEIEKFITVEMLKEDKEVAN